MAKERLQKILARAGIASRRGAEELIREGMVTINGKIAQLGTQADFSKDSIKVRGKLLRKVESIVFFAFHKPKGVISMLADPQGRPTLADFLGKIRERVFPIGRLDYNSEGIILLTNNGDFAQKLQHSMNIPRVYHVKVTGHPTPEMISSLERGMRVGKQWIQPHSVRLIETLSKKSKIEIIFVGKSNIDVKAYFERKGLLVVRLIRIAIGHLTLKDLAPGYFKPLSKSQVMALLEQPHLGLMRS